MAKKIFVIILLICSITWEACENEVVPAPVDCTQNPVELSVVSVDDSNCLSMDGSIEVLASGGSGNYRYSIDGGDEQTSAVFNNIAAGVHEVTAMDDNDCSVTMEVSVKNINGMNIEFETAYAGCKTSEGTLTVTASGGTEPYQFKLGSGAFAENNSFTGLSAGEHQLVVTDGSGCEITQDVTITSGVSFSGSISGIIETECAISGCHNGTQFPDFRVFKNIHDNASQVKKLTGNGTMPQGGSLTQEQIDLIACWVDDGALEN